MKACAIFPLNLGELGELEVEVWGDYYPAQHPKKLNPAEFYPTEAYLLISERERLEVPLSIFPDIEDITLRALNRLTQED